MHDNPRSKVIVKLADFPPPFGGVSVFTENFYNFLIKRKVDFVFFSFGEKTIDREKVVAIKVRSLRNVFLLIRNLLNFRFVDRAFQRNYKIYLPLKDRLGFFLKAILLSKWLNRETDYSVLCDHLGKIQIVFVYLKLQGYSVDIHTYLHGAGIIESYDKEPALYKTLTNLSATYIVASKFMGDVYNQKKDKITDVRTCPYLLSESFFRKNQGEKENIILFIGSLIQHKNPVFLLNEWIKARDCLGKFRLIIIGEGPLKSSLMQVISDNRISNVSVCGELSRDQIEDYLNKAKYLILPSNREPFGIVITEAMAKRVVPIVSDRGGMKEIFSDQSGHVFELKDGHLADILKLIASNDKDYEMKCELAFQDSLKYSEEVVGERLLNILLE